MLLPLYEDGLEIHGVEYNWEMIRVARLNLDRTRRRVSICRADVGRLPYAGGMFNTLVNTMAFTGYPDGEAAMSEMHRVLKPEGKLVMVDVNYPQDENWLGVRLTQAWIALGDLVRVLDPVFRGAGFDVQHEQIGGWGSVHLYVATKTG
jgi:ubiquinone/menaquinone biosynthesis C-methylase UbiE